MCIRDRYSDSLTIADMKDKTAPEKLQGYWLLEISELAGMKKMDCLLYTSILAALTDERVTKWAFNANFERVCLSRYLGMPNDEFLDPAPVSYTHLIQLSPD